MAEEMEDIALGCRRYIDRVCLITGAGAGIGRATALRLGAEGASLFLTDLVEEGLKETATTLTESGVAVEYAVADASVEEDWINVLAGVRATYGRLDLLVNNAGFSQVSLITEYEVENWRKLHDTDLLGPMIGMKHSLPLLMEAAEGAAIVNVASSMGLMGFPRIPGYSAAKGGLIALTRQTAYDFGGSGIRVNCVCPGPTKTERLAGIVAQGMVDETMLINNVLLKRWARPAEIASVIAFLGSVDASFITAAAIVVDGGQTSH